MLRSGIHKVPTMVSQISPLFHTSTVRPRSRRFISLHGTRQREEEMNKGEMSRETAVQRVG